MNDQFRLIHGNALDELKKLPAESIDSVVCDPPYELGFMGKKWDSSGIAYNVDLWREVLRVLKPGGHLAAFGGTRTYHRMAVAIEDAGFEIRDQMAWAYGSGFPKSLDVAKSIDASDRLGFARDRQLRFTAWMRSTGITSEEINTATASCMASHYLTDKEQPAVATEDMFSKLRPIIRARGHEIPAWVEELVQWRTVESENLKKRKITGTKTAVDLTKVRPVSLAAQGKETSPTRTINLTESHTETAKKWEGWGTALKPAWEPIALARKPFKGTIAGNVVKHGTAALNIEASRVPFASEDDKKWTVEHAELGDMPNGAGVADRQDYDENGRFPANLMHDGSAEVVACFPDDGFASASRFFYTAKASTEDREAGLELFELKTGGAMTDRVDGSAGLQSPRAGAGRNGGRANTHPTVKPTDLMVWLVRLITPPGGTCLDWCMGSGSTGRACAMGNFRFVGIDMTAEYIPIARARIEDAIGPLFLNSQQTNQ